MKEGFGAKKKSRNGSHTSRSNPKSGDEIIRSEPSGIRYSELEMFGIST